MGRLTTTGQEMTDAEADSWSDRFENLQSSDLRSRRPGPGLRGRPSLSGIKEHSPKVQTRVSQLLYDKLDRYAQTTGITLSAALRDAIEKLVKNSTP